MKTLEKILFAISVISAFLGMIGLLPNLILVILIICIAGYLLFGWLLLSSDIKNEAKWIPFMIGYLIAQSLIALIFGINKWPMHQIISGFTTFLVLIAIIAIAMNKEKLSIKYPINRYFIRLIVSLFISLSSAWVHILQ